MKNIWIGLALFIGALVVALLIALVVVHPSNAYEMYHIGRATFL
jgi:hypothetical protein